LFHRILVDDEDLIRARECAFGAEVVLSKSLVSQCSERNFIGKDVKGEPFPDMLKRNL
jgi:hypothetical protein